MSVNLKLTVHHDRIYKKSNVELKMMQQELSDLPPVEEGEISFYGIYTVNWEDKLEVGFYLRNATKDTIFFNNTKLLIENSQGDILAEQIIDLSEMGDIEPYSAMPWEIYFDKANVTVNNIEQDWKIATSKNEKVPYLKVIEDKNPEPLTSEQLTALMQVLRKLDPPVPGELGVTPYSIAYEADGTLKAGIIVRNGLTQPVSLSRFQMGVLDGNKEIIAKAVFNTEETILEPGMFLFRTFKYPVHTVLSNTTDLKNWTVVFL